MRDILKEDNIKRKSFRWKTKKLNEENVGLNLKIF